MGLFELLGILDYEIMFKYVFNIFVIDKGIFFWFFFQLLIVFVVDVNDNGLEFNQSLFFGNVSENQFVGIFVMMVSVYDFDSGENGVLIYSIFRGNLNYKFVINGSSGVFYMNLMFDCEEKDEYIFIVYVMDNVYFCCVGICIVKIKVFDVNDYRFVFIFFCFNLIVLEYMVFFDFYMLRVLDFDIGQNGCFCYIIQCGNEDVKFLVGEFMGVFLIIGQFDREIKFWYDLVIEVRNVVVLFYNFSIYVIIFVGDKNDNLLKFVNIFYSLNIWEFIKIGIFIFCVKVMDGDLGKNGEIMFFLSIEVLGIFCIDFKLGIIYIL